MVSFVALQSCAQQQLFDIVGYTVPLGWSKSQKPETLTFTKETGNNFCIVTIYKSIDATNNAQNNFDFAWKSLVQGRLNISGQATMQPGSTDSGWETKLGNATFEKDGVKGVVMMINSSRNRKAVNIIVLTNTTIFQKDLEQLLEGIDLNATLINKKEPVTATATKTTSKPELWVNRRILYHYGSVIDGNNIIVKDFIVIFPNGDFNPNVPYQGLIGFTPSQQPESWGKFTMQNKKGRFKSKYDDFTVTKKSEVHMEKDGYTYGFYKCLPVDGMTFQGVYNSVSPLWGQDPKLDYLNGPGCQYVIYFNKDGTFEDRGIFYGGSGNCLGGKGRYHIENFTITFNYSDGRSLTRLFAAPPTRNLAAYNETIYIGHTPYYKKAK